MRKRSIIIELNPTRDFFFCTHFSLNHCSSFGSGNRTAGASNGFFHALDTASISSSARFSRFSANFRYSMATIYLSHVSKKGVDS